MPAAAEGAYHRLTGMSESPLRHQKSDICPVAERDADAGPERQSYGDVSDSKLSASGYLCRFYNLPILNYT
jgi:hypothetical protein